MASRTPFISALIALLFVVALTLLGGAYYPDYSHLSQFISELRARQAPEEHLARDWLSSRWRSGARLCHRGIPGTTALCTDHLGLLGIAAYALGYVAAAFYPCDPGCRPAEPSTSQRTRYLAFAAGLGGYWTANGGIDAFVWERSRPYS